MVGCCTTPSSELSDAGGVAARREGNIPAEAGKYSRISSPAIAVQSWAPSPCVADGGGVESRGVTVCTPRQQQQLQRQLQHKVDEKPDAEEEQRG